ncbi:MAG: gephyrin-like molybdotransferase Glp [Pseudomonadota bacterium]
MTRRLIDDCFRVDADRPLVPHQNAIARLRDVLTSTVTTEHVPLAQAMGRTTAIPIIADSPIPPADNAAVDGYAVHFSELSKDNETELNVAGVARAGHPFDGPVPNNTSIRILTGAVVPASCDAIAMQEDCGLDAESNTVRIPPGLRRGANIRPAGEDVAAGTQICAAGHRLHPQDLAAVASAGVGDVICFRRPRVGLFSTGDELRQPGSGPLNSGEIFDANSAMLSALITNAGAAPEPLGSLPDDEATVRTALSAAADAHDVIITSGGASAGSEDHIARVLGTLGQRHLWRINIKPGRPMLFGQIGDTIVVGLPGNPVAAFVCFHLYVWPILRTIGGAPWPEPKRLPLPAAFSFKGRKQGRREYWRGWLNTDPATGAVTVDRFPRDGSGLITSIRLATGLIEVSEEAGDVSPGDFVSFIPLDQFR